MPEFTIYFALGEFNLLRARNGFRIRRLNAEGFKPRTQAKRPQPEAVSDVTGAGLTVKVKANSKLNSSSGPAGKPKPLPLPPKPTSGAGLPPHVATAKKRRGAPERFLFKKGQPSANPNGRPRGTFNASTLLRNALVKVQQDGKFDIFEMFVKQARYTPQLMQALMNKLVPTKSEISFGKDEIEQAQAKFIAVVAKHVTDPAMLAAIATDLEQVVEEFGAIVEEPR